MNQRGEGNSTAIVAIVVLVLVALGVFAYTGGLRRGPGEVKITIDQKGGGQPQQQPAER